MVLTFLRMTFGGGGRACMSVIFFVRFLRHVLNMKYISGFKFAELEMSK